jgi:hypothetical protein
MTTLYKQAHVTFARSQSQHNAVDSTIQRIAGQLEVDFSIRFAVKADLKRVSLKLETLRSTCNLSNSKTARSTISRLAQTTKPRLISSRAGFESRSPIAND